MDTSDVALDTRFFCLFKGDPGTGKSIAAALALRSLITPLKTTSISRSSARLKRSNDGW